MIARALNKYIELMLNFQSVCSTKEEKVLLREQISAMAITKLMNPDCHVKG